MRTHKKGFSWAWLAGAAIVAILPAKAQALPQNVPHNAVSTQATVLTAQSHIAFQGPLFYQRKPALNLAQLEECESGGRYIKIIDSNGKYSYGWLQFQLGTFRAYGERYGLIPAGLPAAELEKLTKDRELQFSIARAMLQEDPMNWQHWKNCALKQLRVGILSE